MIATSSEIASLTENQRRELFEENLGQLEVFVNSRIGLLPSSVIALHGDDLRQVARFALWKAALAYDPQSNVPLFAYAHLRIRGAILDELRKIDTMPRRMRAMKRRIEARRIELEQQKLCTVDDDEVLADLQIDERTRAKLKSNESVSFISLDSCIDGDEGQGSQICEFVADEKCGHPSSEIDRDEDSSSLDDCLERLSPVERSAVKMYHINGIPLKDISKCLGLTESRLCQIMDTSLEKLRKLMQRKHAK
ncbi:MAG: sigma-70 family RNA polymerase sigma factor [Candidatus Taylorbacteria bacterium]|nr:sigma-70 family RNA polymerase sigma factor [Candidatus Taylorbacteria bacterium]